MKRNLLTFGMVLAGALSAGTVLADHNSPWGEGWANMPNDVHNTRLDTRDDNEAFIDFVRYGNGAESVNRFADATDQTGGRAATAGAMTRAGGTR